MFTVVWIAGCFIVSNWLSFQKAKLQSNYDVRIYPLNELHKPTVFQIVINES